MALEWFVSLTYETVALLDYFFYFIHFSFTLTLVTVSLLLVHQLLQFVDTLVLSLFKHSTLTLQCSFS